MPFFILFIVIPLSELFVFVTVSGEIGLGSALLISLITAILGGAVVRYQGMQTIRSAHEAMQHGEIPSKELFDGLCLVAAGATLITPGFITDALGFALLVPAFRTALRNKLINSGKFKMEGFGTEYSEYSEYYDSSNAQRPIDPTVIDVEYETVEEKDEKDNAA